jgi:hypothetical protein
MTKLDVHRRTYIRNATGFLYTVDTLMRHLIREGCVSAMSGGSYTQPSVLVVLEGEAGHLEHAGARVLVAVRGHPPLNHAESAIAHVHERGAQMLAGVRFSNNTSRPSFQAGMLVSPPPPPLAPSGAGMSQQQTRPDPCL